MLTLCGRASLVLSLCWLSNCFDAGDDTKPPEQPDAPSTPMLANTCSGACAATSVEIRKDNQLLATLERAQFGIEPDVFYVEFHRGGVNGCPTEQSPTPSQTITLGNIKRFVDLTPQNDTEGLASFFLDFEGLILTDEISVKATAATVTPVAKDDADQWIAFDFTATYAGGYEARGHIYAERCTILDRDN